MHPLLRCFFAACSCFFALQAGAAVDLRRATVFVPREASPLERKTATVLIEEIAVRSQITLPLRDVWPTDGPIVAIVGAQSLPGLPADVGAALAPAPQGREGFRIHSFGTSVVVAGNSPVGALFGVGHLLRQLRMERQIIEAPDNLRVATSPQHSLRGHQIGFRPKVNSYDGWTPAMFDQYVRDLAVFGTNAIELIPPRSDDEDDSPHFTLPKIEMMVEWSRIIASYGLQVWIWFPAMDPDYSNPRDVEFALKEWREVFRRLPKIDGVLVPGGDPGHTRPKHLMAMLEQQVRSLHEFHPQATMWVSPQGFTGEWMEEFLGLLKAEPGWLSGIAFGPQVRIALPELRARVPARYAIRLYPDITHSIHCEYAVPDWDLAYAVSMGREVANPRPADQADIFRFCAPHTVGTITYSEGIHDDVNKIIWSALGWDPQRSTKEILREYARYFVSYRFTEGVAEGLLNLERNWRGPLLGNSQVESTLAQFRSLERMSGPPEMLSWRFQQMLYRAYFDSYVRARLINETALEQKALEKLRQRESLGSMLAMNEAETILDQAVTNPVATDLKGRMSGLAEALYQSIRAQLTVDRHRALAVSRGASLDTADHPLNNRWWLKSRFADARRLPNELDRLAALERILERSNPGPGGFYDDLGNLTAQPRLESGLPYAKDPGHLFGPRVSHLAMGGGMIGLRSVDAVRPDFPGSPLPYPTAWWSFVEAKWDGTISMRYNNLDPAGAYRLRVVYVSRGSREARVRLVANERIEIHPYLKKAIPFDEQEFEIPPAAIAEGQLRLTWSGEPGAGGSGAGPMIAEVFLLRTNSK